MDTNPFGSPVVDNHCEDLEDLIRSMRKVNSLSWQFNPWHHRLLNWIVNTLTPTPRRLIYADDYIGNDRRAEGKIRQLVNSQVRNVRMMLMTKTEKLPISLSEETTCEFTTWPSCCSLSDVALRKTSGLSTTEFSRLRASNIMSIFSKNRQRS